MRALNTRPAETLMVGDRAYRDGGAVTVGMTTVILASIPIFTQRGLDIVLRIAPLTA